MTQEGFEKLLIVTFAIIFALVVGYFFSALVVYIVCKCFGWAFRWIYPLAVIFVVPILRNIFHGR